MQYFFFTFWSNASYKLCKASYRDSRFKNALVNCLSIMIHRCRYSYLKKHMYRNCDNTILYMYTELHNITTIPCKLYINMIIYKCFIVLKTYLRYCMWYLLYTTKKEHFTRTYVQFYFINIHVYNIFPHSIFIIHLFYLHLCKSNIHVTQQYQTLT